MKRLIKESIGEVSGRNDSEINTSGPHLFFFMAVQMENVDKQVLARCVEGQIRK